MNQRVEEISRLGDEIVLTGDLRHKSDDGARDAVRQVKLGRNAYPVLAAD